MLIADLNINLAKLSISVSFDGGMMHDRTFFCGISSQDTTQHRIFVFDVNIEDECSIGPTYLSINKVGELARSYMKSKGIDLTSDKFTIPPTARCQKRRHYQPKISCYCFRTERRNLHSRSISSESMLITANASRFLYQESGC